MKKMNPMMDGGVATTAAPGRMKNPAKRAEHMAMREGRMKSRIMDKFNKLSSRFPGYKPTLSDPVDTREEMKSFRQGLKDYRMANRPNMKRAAPVTMRGGGMANAGGRTSPSSSGSVAGRGPSGGRTSPSSSGSVAGRGPSASSGGRFAAGGMVRGAGCAKRGLKISKKMG